MRVLRIFHSGVVSAWRQRERELRALGHDVTLLTARRWNEGGSDVHLQPDPQEQVDVADTVGRHPALFCYDPRPIWRLLGEQWDVIDIHEEPFALATAEILALRALRRQRAPYVLYSAQNLEKRYPVPFRWFERWSLRHASAIVVCNQEAARIVRRKGFPGVPDVVPLGVDTQWFSPPAPVVDTFATLGAELTADRPVRVGYVGRLAPHKGVNVLIDAAARDPRLELLIVGSGPQETELRRRVEKDPGLRHRVTFHGPATQEELPVVMHTFDALAVPSLTTPGWAEQFGRVAMEAMAAKVPVVVSDSGALPAVVGNAGMVVPEGDPVALAERLVEVGTDEDLARLMRVRGWIRAQQASWAEVAQRYADVYRRITRELPDGSRDDPEVLVVAYHAEDLLRLALEPLADALPLTVVDNSSSPAVEQVCDELGVRYLDPGWNGGFAAGVNHGLAHRQDPCRDVLLLNPDAAIGVDAVRSLHRALRAERDLASVAPAQVDARGHPARVAWPFPSPLRSWIEALGLGRINDRHQDYVIGSVMLLSARALCQVGPFDDDFFLYSEETDWARRASLLGWRHRLVPTVVASHVGAGTSTDASERQTHVQASQERYLRKHHGDFGWQVARLGQWLGAVVRAGLLPGGRGREAALRAELLRRGPQDAESVRFPRPGRP